MTSDRLISDLSRVFLYCHGFLHFETCEILKTHQEGPFVLNTNSLRGFCEVPSGVEWFPVGVVRLGRHETSFGGTR